jgi:hypothetical protein
MVDVELQSLARGEDGQSKKLDQEQLQSIKENVEFRVHPPPSTWPRILFTLTLQVASKNYPGNYHVWSVRSAIYHGRKTLQEKWK